MKLIIVQCCKLIILLSRLARLVDANTKGAIRYFYGGNYSLNEDFDVVYWTPTPERNPRAKLTAEDPRFNAI